VANTLWDPARNTFLIRGSDAIDWDAAVANASGSIRVGVVKTSSGYTFSASDQYFSALGSNLWTNAGNQTYNGGGSDSNTLTGTASAGVADAGDITLTAVANSSVACGAMAIWQQGAAAGSSPLILYLDTASGLPITPNGQDMSIVWDNGSNKIFKL
jgi:hypothetical protein